MAYTINKYNGLELTQVEDGTVNSITELRLVGKNYAGYGEIQNENMIHMLENFSSSVSPTRPITGMLWYDVGTTKIKFYDGTQWKTTGGAEASTTEPAGLNEGDFWWNSQTNQLYAKSAGGDVVLIGPQSAGTGLTQMRSLEVLDNNAAQHSIISATINDDVVFIISPDEFVLSAEDNIEGFDEIRKGLTLKNTQAANGGVTDPLSDFYFWGTSSNSQKLEGKSAADFISASNTSFNDTVYFSDEGLFLGDDNDLRVRIDTDTTTPVIDLFQNNLRIRDAENAIILEVSREGIIPGIDRNYSLGSNPIDGGKEWDTVYAHIFEGVATKSDRLQVNGSDELYYFANTEKSFDTIVARTGEGNINAELFVGTATQSQYADLAEKYTTKEELEPGTAVAVCSHPDHEVGPASASQLCIGVVSTDPGLMMNSESEGQYIALKGRVPVRVHGAVKKGQAVYAWNDGVCRTISTTALVGIALESNNNEEEKLVECVLKV